MAYHDRYQFRWMYLAALVVLGGCSGSSHASHRDAKEEALSRMLYSPNGEPLNGGTLGRPTCEEGLSRWFAQVDANHEGSLSRDEFISDAQLQFARMDLDKNGYLVSEEIERFRQPYRQQTAAEEASAPAKGNQSQNTHKRGAAHDGHDKGGESREPESPTGDTSDPVMSADTDLDFKVTPAEFLSRARRVFADLDTNHDEALSRDEVLARCKQK